MSELESNGGNGVSQQAEDEIVGEEIESITPATPGWFSCYTDETNSRALHIYPVAVFAIVKVSYANGEYLKVVRPYSSRPDGEIADVADYDNFLCLSGPGQDPRVVASETKEARGEAPRIVMPGA